MPQQQHLTNKATFNKTQNGFTIVEIALVLIIGGIITASLSSALLTYFNQVQVDNTRQRMAAIQDAVETYLAINQRLPCPSPITIGVDGAGFGREADAVAGPGTSCSDAALAGVTNVGTGPNRIKMGSVPVRALNLPDDHIIDAFQGRFTYAVTANLATDGGYTPGAGAIRTIDSGANVIADDIEYIIISHGRDNSGALNLGDGGGAPPAIMLPCPAAGTTLDAENCDNADNIFRRTILTSDQQNANRYDDFVVFNSLALAQENIIPTGMIAAFNLPACPSGWGLYTAAAGRFIVGFGTLPAQTYTNPYDATITWDAGNIQFNTIEGTTAVAGSLPPTMNPIEGTAIYSLSETELAEHTHAIPSSQLVLNQSVAVSGSPAGSFPAQGNGLSSGVSMALTPNPTGASNVINNLPPFITLRYCRKN